MSTLLFIICILFSPLGFAFSPRAVRAEIFPANSVTAGVMLRISPDHVRNGDAVLFELVGRKVADVKSGTFLGNTIDFFIYKNRTIALLPVDFSKKAGTYDAKVLFKDGTQVIQKVIVESRAKQVEKLGIPEKLGGN